jgi:hypothetical protein
VGAISSRSALESFFIKLQKQKRKFKPLCKKIHTKQKDIQSLCKTKEGFKGMNGEGVPPYNGSGFALGTLVSFIYH